MRAQARNALAARRAANAKLRRNFADADEWLRLATQFDVRLPEWTMPMTPSAMLTRLRRVGLTLTDFRTWSGFHNLQDFVDANPGWPLRAFVGLMLEDLDRRRARSQPKGVTHG